MSRRIGTVEQSPDEGIYYGIDSTNWGALPTNVTVVVKDITDPYTITTVTDTVLSDSASVDGNIITLPKLSTLTARRRYRMEIKFTDSSANTWECWLEVVCNE